MSSSFSLLDAAIGSDRKDWLSLWQQWSTREVFAHPSYVELFARPYERSLCAALTVNNEPKVLFTFILRNIKNAPWCTQLKINAYDITSPYGYGGPFCCDIDTSVGDVFWNSFDTWAKEMGVVTVFARLSLFKNQILPFRGAIVNTAPNVVRGLELSEQSVWADYAYKVRKNVTRARSSGLTIEVDLVGNRLTEFLEIYYLTMARRSAEEGYFFPQEFFKQLIEQLSGQFAFFHVISRDRVVSTELILLSADNIYSFLGGTREESFELRPNDFLKHEVIRWGIACGKKAFILGGGYQAGDGIFRYKSSFAPNGVVEFQTGTRTLDPDLSEQLVGLRHSWEASQSREWSPRLNYFPAYRG